MASSVPLSGLPLFRDVKENVIQQRQEQHQHQQQAAHQARRRNHIKRSATNHHYMPPLSAYNASEERPYYAGGRFDEMRMKIEMEQRRLDGIRNLGCDYIRPIGVGHSLQMVRERKQLAAKLRAEEVAQQEELERHQAQDPQVQHPQPPLLPATFQENSEQNNFYNSGVMDDVAEEPMNTSHPEPMQQELAAAFNATRGEDEEEEDEISYDYEAEFAHVEEEQNEEDEEDEYLDRNRESHLKMLYPRSTTRDFTIQQFVETSHMESHPYEMEDEYENPQLDVETNQGDSGDFTEVPWVNISDTVQNVDSPRVSSLNSLIDRRMISSSTVTTNHNSARLVPPQARRRVSDNNSDQEVI